MTEQISFSVFAKSKLLTYFTEAESDQLNATPERAQAFKALRAAADESEKAEANLIAVNADVAAKMATFAETRDALVKAHPPATFMSEWRKHRGTV